MPRKRTREKQELLTYRKLRKVWRIKWKKERRGKWRV